MSKAFPTFLFCLGSWLAAAALAQERPTPTVNPAARMALPQTIRSAAQTRPSPSPTRPIRIRPEVIAPALERLIRERAQAQPAIDVPNIVNLSVAQARRIVISRGFQFAIAARTASSADDAVVIGQSPTANTKAPRGSTVEVYTRPPTTPQTNLVPVPNVVGASIERARGALNAVKLRMALREQPANETALIASQRPAAGEMVPPGSTVYLTLQATTTTPTPEYTTVPLVIGMTLNDAAVLLRSNRLGWVFVNPPVKGTDKVSAQEPPPRTRVLLGTRVRLTALAVSASPSPSPVTPTPMTPVLERVPNVVGMTLGAARKVLSYEEFRPAVRTVAAQNTHLVIEQTPAANTMARPQSVVTLTVEIPPSPTVTATPTPVVTTPATPTPDLVAVPDLQKQLLPDAVKTLQTARLTLGELLPIESPEAFDTVLGQTPTAGELVPANSNITLVVARPLKTLPAPPTVTPTPTPTPEVKEGVWEQITGLPLFAVLSFLALAGAWALKKLRGSGGDKPPEPPPSAANVQIVPVLDHGVQTLSTHKPFTIRSELRWLPRVDDGEQTLQTAPGGLLAAERKIHEQE